MDDVGMLAEPIDMMLACYVAQIGASESFGRKTRLFICESVFSADG